MEEKITRIYSEYIQLDQLLKWLGLSETGGQAKWLIDAGQVLVNGKVSYERRKKIYPGDIIIVRDKTFRIEVEED